MHAGKLGLTIVFLNVLAAKAQDPLTGDSQNALKIFLDCSFCDDSYIKTEIPSVSYVRERKESDVHLLITSEPTGSGGKKYTLNFIGLGELDKLKDQMEFATNLSDAKDAQRKKLVHRIKLGLVRYLAQNDDADSIGVTFKTPSKLEDIKDPWNFWVYTLGLNGNFSGEKSKKNNSLYSSLSAKRVTEAWKTKFYSYYNRNEDRYDLSGQKIQSVSKDNGVYAGQIKSLGPHWSALIEANTGVSTYSNFKRFYDLSSGVEYNFFPYSESTRRQLRIIYEIGFSSLRYIQETIFDKTSESIWGEALGANAEIIEPWGSLSAGLRFSHFFNDFNKNKTNFNANLSLRLSKGLSLNIGGNAAMIRDQITLPKTQASTEEILLQRAQIATSYRYSTFLGISYSFGSIYNTIVNPRFGN